MTDLSIIIINHNNSKLLNECLRSIIDNTKRISYEITVVDNASKDDSVMMLKRDFPLIKVIENKDNLGFTKANNQGLRLAKGRYSMILNDDTKTLDGAFDKMVGYMDSHPAAGAIGPKLLNTDSTLQRQGSLLGQKFWTSEKARNVDFLMGACLMVRRQTLDKVGFMDENFLFYNDDLDWCRRIRKAGWEIVFYPEASIVHYGGYSTRRTFNGKYFIEGFRGGLYFCRKHYPYLAYFTYRLLLPIALAVLFIFWTLSLPFLPPDKRREYPAKISSLLEILMIDLFGRLIPPSSF